MTRPHRLRSVAVTAVLACLQPLAARAEDPPAKAPALASYPRGGPERTGAYSDVRLPDRPATLWIVDLGRGAGAPVVSGDRLIVGNGDEALAAVMLKDGADAWSVARGNWRVYDAPLVVGDRIYCASNRGISSHALADGSEVWRKEIAERVSEPVVVGDLLVVGGADGFAYGLDARTGAERWKADIAKDAPPDPKGFDGARARIGNSAARPETASSDGKSVFLTIFDQSRVVALDLKTGATRWSFQTKGWVSGAATVGEGKVFLGSQDHKVYALDAETGKLAWSFETRWRADGDLAYCEGSVFVAASDGRCYRIDAREGHKVWEYETPVGPDGKHYFLSCAPLVDATAVYFGSWDGHLYALNREDGTLKWKHKPYKNGEHVGAPITDGHRIYVPLRPLFDYEKQRDKEGIHGIAAIGTAEE